MLVLSRKIGEQIIIGGQGSGLPEITLTVVDVVGNHKMRLGIDAPREVPIVRSELVNRDNGLLAEEPLRSVSPTDVAIAAGETTAHGGTELA